MQLVFFAFSQASLRAFGGISFRSPRPFSAISAVKGFLGRRLARAAIMERYR